MALEEEDVHEAQRAVVKVVLASLMSFSLSRANHFWSLVVDGARANGRANVADVSASPLPSLSSTHPTASFCIAFIVSSSSFAGGGSSSRRLALEALDEA